MLEIPGYRYDAATNRYFKLTAAERAAAATAAAAQASSSQGGSKQSRQQHKKRGRHAQSSQPKQQVDVKPTVRSSASRRTADAAPALLDALASASSSRSDARHAREHIQHLGLTRRMGCLTSTTHEEPGITLGDTVTRFVFDEADPSIIRYGTTFGILGHGRLSSVPAPFGHSVTSWRTDQVLSAEVTSLNCHRGRILATSFGPTCQAFYGNLAEDGHVGSSVILSPRKTSLWTSSLHDTTIALGCDKKIMVSPDPTKAEMRSYGTGSAVFALQQEGYVLTAGTRSGQVRLYDLRSTRENEQEARPVIARRLSTSVTHARRLPCQQVLVALMDGTIDIHDLRYMTPDMPSLMTLHGHVNSRTQRLGLDTYHDKILAAVGEDARVRLWSLVTGKQIEPTQAQSVASGTPLASKSMQLCSATFAAPPSDIRFQEGERRRLHLWVADGSYIRRFDGPDV